MSQVHNIKLIPIIIIIFLSFSLSAHALKEDRKEMLHIAASSFIGNVKTGIKIYEGDVRIDQGTTHIRADRLVTKYNKDNKMEEAIAYGYQVPAHFWTIPKIGDPELHAHARIIKFYPIDFNITLEQDVQIIQGENSFKGELVHYNNNDETILVPKTKNSRAVFIYNPDK